MSSCYNKTNKVLLPNPYTIANIKTAFLEYINFRLWYYPVEYSDRQPSDFYFDDYSGQEITSEIRIYSNSSVSEQSEKDPIICISTNITQQLAVFSHQGDNVYCLGLTSDDDYTNTVGKNYTVIKQYQFVIPEVRLPDFGASEQKNNMIQMAAEAVTADCVEWFSYGDEEGLSLKSAEVYIANFYEYESPRIYICKHNGSIIIYPVIFDFKNDIIEMTKMTPIVIEDIRSNPLAEHQFQLDKTNAVSSFKVN